MLTKCRFCNYQKETKMSEPILRVMSEKDLPEEDWLLWMERLIKHFGFGDYNSVKIHMGMKHKKDTYKYISPISVFDKKEEAIIND